MLASVPLLLNQQKSPLMTRGREPNWQPSVLSKKGMNSIIVLGAWIISKHYSRCVFEEINLNMAEMLILAAEEHRQWVLAGVQRAVLFDTHPPKFLGVYFVCLCGQTLYVTCANITPKHVLSSTLLITVLNIMKHNSHGFLRKS
jgi:hypothetical protein